MTAEGLLTENFVQDEERSHNEKRVMFPGVLIGITALNVALLVREHAASLITASYDPDSEKFRLTDEQAFDKACDINGAHS